MNDPFQGNGGRSRRRDVFGESRRSERRDAIESALSRVHRSERKGVLRALWELVLETALSVGSFLQRMPGFAGWLRARQTRTTVGLGVLMILIMATLVAAERTVLAPMRRTATTSALVKVNRPSALESPIGAILEGTESRAYFNKPFTSVALGRDDIVEVEAVNTNQLRIEGQRYGTTSLTVGFEDETEEIYTLTVEPSLALLRQALGVLDPRIEPRIDVDRNAIVLTGFAQTNAVARDAMAMALDYVASSAPEGGIEASVVNGLELIEPHPSRADRVQKAIEPCKPHQVIVSQVDDQADCGVLVLTGTVPDQETLTCILSIVSTIYQESCEDSEVGEIIAEFEDGKKVRETKIMRPIDVREDLRVVSDESGGLRLAQQQQQQANRSGNQSRLLGGSNSNALSNLIDSNLGRATAVQLGGGRVLSFVEVDDLPQVRIDIRLVEVSRRALLDYNSEFSASWSEDAPTVAANAGLANSPTPRTLGTAGAGDVQEVFGFLGGAFANRFQLQGNDWAVDTALSLLESEGIAKSLANPSLTVLSGEVASFSVGGRVPTNANVATDANVVLQGVEFVDFGVELHVKPQIDRDGFVTVDVAPTVSQPDSDLTDSIRQSTGTNQTTTSFSERRLGTSARLRDGQTLLIGGLGEKSRTDDASNTPFIHEIPLLGSLFKSFTYADQDRDLVFIITPTVIRDPIPGVGLWAWPDMSEVMGALLPQGDDDESTAEEDL